MDINKTHRSNERVQPPWPEDMEEALKAQGQWLENQKVSPSSGIARKRDVEKFTASPGPMMQKARQERMLPLLLHLFTAVTGLVDAVSYIALGHVFTANMTGNIVFLGFALAGVPGVSALRCLTALAAFLIGALIGGRLATSLACPSSNRWRMTALGSEAIFLLGATLASVGYASVPSDSTRLYTVIILTALAMGLRNATVRKIAQPDLTTTVLTLTITGLAADSFFAGGNNPRWQRRVMSILFMFAGAVVGALLLRHSLALPLALATVSVGCGVAALYGNRHLERTETPISAKVPNEAQPNPISTRTNHD